MFASLVTIRYPTEAVGQMRSSVLHRYEMSTRLKNKITVVLGAGLLSPSQFQQDVAVATGLLLSSETVGWVGTGASTEVGNVQ